MAAAYEGPKVPVKLRQGEGAWPFRTAIREAYGATPVNFAGRFVAVEWPCGAPCQSWAIVDARTGAVYLVPFPTAGGAEFRATSALFVADPAQCVGNECEEPAALQDLYSGIFTSYYFWNGDALEEIPRQDVDPSSEQQARSFLELTEAAGAGDLRKVEWMLQRGVDAKHPPMGESEAAYFSQLMDPLQGAAERGSARVIAVLLANGADPNWQCCGGETALVLAAANNHLDTVEVLLAGGADPLSPFFCCGEQGATECRAVLSCLADAAGESKGIRAKELGQANDQPTQSFITRAAAELLDVHGPGSCFKTPEWAVEGIYDALFADMEQSKPR